MPIRIVLTGPESTGKSQLSKQLASKLKAHHLPEYARYYLDNLDRPYALQDLKNIEKGQKTWEKKVLDGTSSNIIVQDTDFLTIWIWYGYKYGMQPRRVIDYLKHNLPDLYLLCYPDLPWTSDSQRENPKDRLTLFDCHILEIDELEVPYSAIKGRGKERLENVYAAVRKLTTF